MSLPINTEHASKTASAMQALSEAMLEDPDYAWSWHCNLACCAMDEGLDHEAANRAAERFMALAFNILRVQYGPASNPSMQPDPAKDTP